nr:class I SAM-dependent methyltransferase [Actinocorallia populi]
MYARADVYEAFYRGRGKDYAAESEIVIGHVRDRAPAAASLLDVACGTGSHLKFFTGAFDRVAGLDISAEMLEIARSYVPDVPVTQGDMRDFTLGETFDAITCMFSSFGYLPTEEDLDATLRTFARHLNPGGVVVVEPWWFPDTFTPGHVAGDVVAVDGRTISRISHTVREPHGRASRMEVNYVVAERESGLRHFTDTHVMSLFDRERYQAAFERAGLTVEYVPYEHVGPGLFVGVRGK